MSLSSVQGTAAQETAAQGTTGQEAADGAAQPAAAAGRFRLRGSFTGNELAMMFRRTRNLALLGALATIPIALGVAIKLTTRHQGGDGFIGQVSNNGLFLVFSALTITLPVFLPLAVGVVAGDSISGEAGQGTLRYLLV